MTVSGMPWPTSTPRPAPPRAPAAGVAPITTPTGLRVAGVGRRVVPYLLDRLVVLLLFAGAAVLMEASGVADLAAAGRLGPTGEAAVLLTGIGVWVGPWLLVLVAVPALTGTTPGKALLGLEIVTWHDGLRPSVWRLLARFAVTAGLAGVPFGSVVDHLCALWQGRWATVHDLAAGTAVVHAVRPTTPR